MPLLTGLTLLAACAGAPPEAPVLELHGLAPKMLRFRWAAAQNATSYNLSVDPDRSGNYVPVVEEVTATSYDHTIPIHFEGTAQYRLEACNEAGCTPSEPLVIGDEVIQAIGYLKASNTGANDQFGHSIALSSDGNTLAVGARCESSNATGTDGDPSDDSTICSGAVYVFSRSGSEWTQQAYVKACNTGTHDQFGFSVALSSDGNTLAVGAVDEDSNATGIDGDPSDNSAHSSGAVYVFDRSKSGWTQQAYVKASNTGADDQFGHSIALSSDGNTLAVGAVGEESNATGIDGDPSDNSAHSSGAVYVFDRSKSEWTQQAYVKASNTEAADQFGCSVALSNDGNTLAVGAYGEDSDATGTAGDPSDNSAEMSGAVHVFVRSGSAWTQQAYVKASNTGVQDGFGWAVALSSDGNTLAVGAIGEDSNTSGVGGNQSDNSAIWSGAVYVFSRSVSEWTQQAYVKASDAGEGDRFGLYVALSSDGNTLAVGAAGEGSNATGIDGDPSDDSAIWSGAAYVFARNGSAWAHQAYAKASNTDEDDLFGFCVALSSDGNTLAVGAHGEASNATGMGGNQSDNSVEGAGAVYLF
jgi:hypothetical protein